MKTSLFLAACLGAASCLTAADNSAGLAVTTTNEPTPFRPGQVWLDTEGKPIQAHGGGILFDRGTYYWYGENKDSATHHRRADVVGVSCYSSSDLHHWTNEGVVLPAVQDDRTHPLHPSKVCERPKVVYCPKTHKYVMWLHLDNAGYFQATAGVALADQPVGPFRFDHHSRPIQYPAAFPENDRCRQKELGGTFRDMNLFVDDDGQAYVFYASENNATMYVVRLNASYTAAESPPVLGQTWARILIGQSREAPAPFKYQGTYYLITSGCTGWAPNAAHYATAKNILGPWRVHENPCSGPEAELTFRAQSTFVLPLPNRPGTFIFMADRWNPEQLGDSRYLWLPLQVTDGKVSVVWQDQW